MFAGLSTWFNGVVGMLLFLVGVGNLLVGNYVWGIICLVLMFI